MSAKKTLVPVGHIPGSKPLKVAKYERYARYRAQALPRIEAFRKIGNQATLDKTAHNNATRLEKRPGIRDRINYLTRQAEELSLKNAPASKSVFGQSTKQTFKTFSSPKRISTLQRPIIQRKWRIIQVREKSAVRP